MPDMEVVLKFIETLGWYEGVGTILLFFFHTWIYAMYRGRLKDRQKEIDRIAQENREYREMFVELLDRRFGFSNKKQKQVEK